jgi:[ribosomal protein S18]-alanine N-acetyltransferase
MLRLVANDPLDLTILGQLLSDKDELFLVWPDARFPFDPEQWRERLLSRPGNRSYFVAEDGEIIGHAALQHTEEPNVPAVSYLFIRPDRRDRGLGRALIALLEAEARKTAEVRALKLRVRTYNQRALHIYETSGFVRSEQDGTLVVMRKELLR